MTKRSSLEIWRTLNKELSTIVRSYHHSVVRLPDAIEDLIDGTAFFPGGSGLWRGEKPFGSLPEIFPEHSLLFVGHNFDSVRAFQRTRLRGGEGSTPFWKTLRSILNGAGVPPEQCFFTNALMGLQPGKSTGAMPSTPDYLRQCNLFLTQQIRIVRPRAVISLGKPAYARLLLVNPSQLFLPLAHPTALTYIAGAKRPEWIATQAAALSSFVDALRKSPTPTQLSPAAST